MPSIVSFNGKSIVEPGAYSRIVGGETNPPIQASFGNVLLIDTGSMAGFGYGSGIVGDLQSGPNSIYKYANLDDFRQAVGGSVMWDASKFLFKPSRNAGFRGINSITLIKAATTTKGTATYTWVGGGANGGVFAIHPKVEGVAANGVTNGTSGLIERGFGMRMSAGTLDAAKFVVEFYRGSFRGLDYNSIPFNNIAASEALPELIIKSIEFTNIAELIAWAQTSRAFNSWFVLASTTAAAGTGVVDAADLAASTGNKLVAGGTETYGAGDLQKVFQQIAEYDYSFILCDKYEANMDDTVNFQILAHVQQDSEFKRILVIGGGKDETEYDDTLTTTASFDSELVHVCYSRTWKKDISSVVGKRYYPTIYHACAYLGRIAGQQPQTPATFKDLDFDGVLHEMTKSQRERALLGGVVHQRYVDGIGWVINQDVNTKQANELDIYEDGTSPHGTIMRIAHQLNKELVINLRSKFVGLNANTASPADVKAFAEGYLKLRTATSIDDNLILSFQNVRVQLRGSDYDVKYGFVPNGPVNRFFVTGFMFNVDLSA